jgi:hypothetical protein
VRNTKLFYHKVYETKPVLLQNTVHHKAQLHNRQFPSKKLQKLQIRTALSQMTSGPQNVMTIH